MSIPNINSVTITGNLTRDPDLRSTPGGTSVCKLRVAVNSQRKDGQTGEWVDKPNYFNVTVWGRQGESCGSYLAKGRPVAIEGRLDWREWDAKDGGKREGVEIIANTVQFLGSRDGAEGSQQELDTSGSEESDAGTAGVDPATASDAELLALERSELDEVAVAAGVEGPEDYSEPKDVVDAIRNHEVQQLVAADGEDDIPF